VRIKNRGFLLLDLIIIFLLITSSSCAKNEVIPNKESELDKESNIPYSSSPVVNSWVPYANRYAVIVMGGPANNSTQYGYYWMDTYGMYQKLIALGFTSDNIYFISWGDSAVAHAEVVDRISESLPISVPNGQEYQQNGDYIITSFSLSENTKAYSVAMNCLDDATTNDSSSETFECAITSDSAGNNVLTSAQVTADFKSEGICDGHRYVFNFADISLNKNKTYYLKTRVISGAPVRSWAGAVLYHQGCLVCDCNSSTDNSWTGSMKADIQWAFNEIKLKSTVNDLVYIYWVDHGDPNFFYLPGNNIYHSEVKSLIEGIKAKIIIGAYNPCYSGGLVDDVSRPGVITVTSVNSSQPNAFGWAGHWRQALEGGTSSESSDFNGDGQISILEAYEWVAPKSQAYSPSEHPLIDDNGDKVGSEFGKNGYDTGDPSKDGYIASLYSLTAWKSGQDIPSGNGYAESVYTGTAIKERILDLKSNFNSGTYLILRWTPGNNEKTKGNTDFYVSISSTGPWTEIGLANDTAYMSPPTSSYWITYMTLLQATQNFRYVKIASTNFIDYASAEAVTLVNSKDSSSTYTKTMTIDLGTTYNPSRKTMLAIWFKPGFNRDCLGEVTISLSYSSINGPWAEIIKKSCKTHDNPPGSGAWIDYGFLFVPSSKFRYAKVEITNCFNDMTRVCVLGTTAVHRFGSQPPTP
jgi:hypothetical protein